MNRIVPSKEYMDSRKDLTDDERFDLEDLERRIKFDRVTNGAHRERIKIASGEDVYTYRVGQDLRLAVYLWKPKEYILLRCDHHDRLYARLRRMRVVNVKECELPCFEIIDVREQRPPTPPPPVPPQGRFRGIDVAQLEALGIPAEMAGEILKCHDDDALIGVVEKLDGETLRTVVLDLYFGEIDIVKAQAKVLSAAAAGRRPVEKIVRENAHDAANYFVLDEKDEKQWEEFRNGRLENWQVFLHPSQRDAVGMTANGPAMVTGSAGTGKTVAAVHRVKWLLEHKIGNDGKILFTTFTKTLVDSAKAMLLKLCTPEQFARIEIRNLDDVFRDEWSRFRPGTRIIFNEGDKEDIVNVALGIAIDKLYNGKRSVDFLRDEYEKVILELDIHTLDEYKSAVRSGLLGKVDRETERPVLWQVFERLNRILAIDYKGVCRSGALNMLADAIKNNRYRARNRYSSVVVDEAQDFGGPEYRFLAAMTGNTYEKPIPYSLFVCGDGHQRIYGRSGTLKDCGINVHSRSCCLSTCYRSTLKIRQYAENIIRGVDIKDMNGGTDRIDDVKSLETGETPVEKFFSRHGCRTKDGVYDDFNSFVVEKLRQWHDAGVRYSDMAVLLREAGMRWKGSNDETYLYMTAKTLNDHLIPASLVGRRKPSLEGDTVKVMTMHRAKGLQFYGVIISLDHWPYLGGKSIDDEQKKAYLEQDKCLLYMAIMRATSKVVLTGTKGRPSELPYYIESVNPIPSPVSPDPQVKGEKGLQPSAPPTPHKEMFKKDDGTFVDPDTIMTPSEQRALLELSPVEFSRRTPLELTEFLKKKMHGRLTSASDIRGFYRFLKARASRCDEQTPVVQDKIPPLDAQPKTSGGECNQQKCPYCGELVLARKMNRHIRRKHMHTVQVGWTPPYRIKHKPSPNLEDVQRELYGDW